MSQQFTENISASVHVEQEMFEVVPVEPRLFAARDVTPLINDPFLFELVSTPAVQRLKRIGFLGAIDYLKHGNGIQAHRRRHNRYDHSLGVAALALRYADIRGLDTGTRRTLAAAALLHDIGHGPLSHSLEPVFRDAFGIDHHSAGLALLLGRSPLGGAVASVLQSHGVDVGEVLELIDGKHAGPHAHLFASPINLDTIEGVTRCLYSSVPGLATPPAMRLVEAIAREDSYPVAMADVFWQLKHSMYRMLIHGRRGLIQDAIAQIYMRERLHRFRAEDIYRDERYLRRRERGLFGLLFAARSPRTLANLIPSRLRDEAVSAPVRTFFVDHDVIVKSPASLARRYRQNKTVGTFALGELLPRQDGEAIPEARRQLNLVN